MATEIPYWRLLFTASEMMRNLHSRKHLYSEEGGRAVTLSQARVLGSLLIGEEKGLKVKELAAELGITPGAVSQIVDSLVNMGLVNRSECPSDRRSVTIVLSDSGTELRRRLDSDFSALGEHIFEDVTEEEQKVFRTVLVKMISHMENEKIQELNYENQH